MAKKTKKRFKAKVEKDSVMLFLDEMGKKEEFLRWEKERAGRQKT